MNWDLHYYPTYWAGKKLVYPDVPREHPKFAQSIVVGNLVFVSGCVGQDVRTMAPTPEGVEDQVRLALENTKLAMETAGSSMNNVIKTFFLITSLDDYQAVRKTETEFYEKHAPALINKPPAATLMVSSVSRQTRVSCRVRSHRRRRPKCGGLERYLLPGVLGRKGTRLPPCAEGTRQVRAQPGRGRSRRSLWLPGSGSRLGSS